MSDTIVTAVDPATTTPPADTTATTSTTPTTTPPVDPAAQTTPPATPVTPAAPATPAAAAPDTKGFWPENWRDKFAEEMKPGDAQFRKRLDRFTAPTEIGKSWLALETKQSSGELKRTAPPKDATPEEVSAWRKEAGLPDKPEDYKVELPDGIVLSDADKPTVENFQKFAFEQSLPPDVMNKTLGWYYAEQERLQQQRELVDGEFHERSKEDLISDWGIKDYRTNLAAMSSLRDQMPQGLPDRLLAGRTADGMLIGDDPQFLRWFAQVSREVSPTATLAAVGVDSMKAASDQIAEIQKTMRDDPQKYWKDSSLQARYRELIEARDKLAARAG